MMVNRARFLVAVMLVAGAAVFLYNQPIIGRPCPDGGDMGKAIDGTPLVCLAGTWRDAIEEDWHLHGSSKFSTLVERVAPKGWTVDWRAKENPIVDTEALWRAKFMWREGYPDPVTRALVEGAQYGVTPYLVACYDDAKHVVVIDHSKTANCKSFQEATARQS